MSHTKYPVVKKAKMLIKENQDLFVALEELDRTGKLRKAKYKKRYNFPIWHYFCYKSYKCWRDNSCCA